jgi:uncharacterized protein
MAKTPIYDFEWDPSKARSNIRKHGVSFERGATVFLDPHALSMFDEDHSRAEDRWITMGQDRANLLLVVHHTFVERTDGITTIRIFSARRAAKHEANQYEGK